MESGIYYCPPNRMLLLLRYSIQSKHSIASERNSSMTPTLAVGYIAFAVVLVRLVGGKDTIAVVPSAIAPLFTIIYRYA